MLILVRADKLIASNTALSRKDAAKLIRSGQVLSDGIPVTSPDQKLSETALLCINGRTVAAKKFVYLMMNKPSGLLSVSRAPTDRTVTDLLTPELKKRELFPAGRLDRDTTGFVLLTDDGVFAHNILAPKKHIPKTYEVRLDTPVTDEMARGFADGTVLADGSPCAPSVLIPDETDPFSCEMVLTQGMYHQIKRMFGVYGAGVVTLHRSVMGNLRLDPALAPGEYRELTEEELQAVSGR